MSPYSFIRCCLLVAGVLAVGCAPGAGTIAVVPRDEVSQLPTTCEPLASFADEDLAWARAEGDGGAIVLDTPNGSCVARRETVLSTLSEQNRDELVAHITRDFAKGDPAPHPDISSTTTAGADPSPHPDKPQGTTSADPAPHPDKDDDSDDAYTVLVVGVVIGGAPSGGGTQGAPPPPAPPVPNKAE